MNVPIKIVCKLCNHLHTNLIIEPDRYLPMITYAPCLDCGVKMRMTITKKQDEIEVRSSQ